MTARRGLVIASVTLLVAAAIAGAVGLSRVREGRQTTQDLQTLAREASLAGSVAGLPAP